MPSATQTRPIIFTYTDDRELEMFRLALRTIGKQMQHPTDDPYSAAQQLLQSQQQHSMWGGSGPGMGGGYQRSAGMGAPTDTYELDHMMMQLLSFMDTKAPSALGRLNLQRPSGLTLLHLASSLGLTRFVVGLLMRGADHSVIDNNGHTPMHCAAMYGHTHIIRRLRLAGGSPKSKDLRNFTPAELAPNLLVWQAVVMPLAHYSSGSAAATPRRLRSRRGSMASSQSFLDNISASYEADSSDAPDESVLNDSDTPAETFRPRGMPLSVPPSRRPSNKMATPDPVASSPNMNPTAYMLAWRDHLVDQVAQFHESAQT